MGNQTISVSKSNSIIRYNSPKQIMIQSGNDQKQVVKLASCQDDEILENKTPDSIVITQVNNNSRRKRISFEQTRQAILSISHAIQNTKQMYSHHHPDIKKIALDIYTDIKERPLNITYLFLSDSFAREFFSKYLLFEDAIENLNFYLAVVALESKTYMEFVNEAKIVVDEFIRPKCTQEVNIQYTVKEQIISAIERRKTQYVIMQYMMDARKEVINIMAGIVCRYICSHIYFEWIKIELQLYSEELLRQQDQKTPTIMLVMQSLQIMNIVGRLIVNEFPVLIDKVFTLEELLFKLKGSHCYFAVLIDLESYPNFIDCLQSMSKIKKTSAMKKGKNHLRIVGLSQNDRIPVEGSEDFVQVKELCGDDCDSLLSASLRKPFSASDFIKVIEPTGTLNDSFNSFPVADHGIKEWLLAKVSRS